MQKISEYDGSILVHARAINDAKRVAENTGDRSQRPLPFGELWDFLSLVSLCALGSRIYFDSSIPEQFATEAQESARFLGLSSFVEASPQPNPERFQLDTATSVENASPLFEKVIESRVLIARRVSEDRAASFFELLGRMAKEEAGDTKRSIALEAYNNDVMGGKILVGLSDPRNEMILNRLSTHVSKSPPSRHTILLPELVNTFRYFLLSNWSGGWKALYATNPDTEQIGARYRRMVWPMIEREVYRRARATGLQLPDKIRKRDPTEQVLPLVGLAALDRAKPGDRPIDLFPIAQELAKQINLKTMQKQLIDSQVAYEGGKEPDEIARELWRRIREIGGPRYLPKRPSTWRRAVHQISPALVSGAASWAAKLALIAESQWAPLLLILATGSGARFLWVLGRTLIEKGQETNYLAVLSHLSAVAQDVPMLEVSEKVKVVWRRELLIQ